MIVSYVLSVLLLFTSQSGNETLNGLRDKFFLATDAKGVENFYLTSQKYEAQSPLYSAYHGTALAMKAGHSSGIMSKLDLFGQGKERLEKAVKDEPGNVEIRFLRYSVQANVPSILLYSSDMDDDYNLIIKELQSQRTISPFWRKAVKAMIDSDKTDKARQNTLRKFLEK